ncbi:prohead protease/major capsid protein fusion protein [Paraburkholderia sp. J11-2]|uniref:prohead protease/major capsid protein fusion protein n=1 Tax=Paraburkholderia sp. J11-2 TaxID=2805431 RepID=UPI002AB68C78|nr:prohead protease/major capsid protein fusion protein [Paraburkholderia sp. J11-2]
MEAALPLSRRDMPIVSVDTATRTVDCTWTAGAQVLRYDWYRDRPYLEELSTDPEHVNMQRLQSGNAPVLNAHNAWDVTDVIGVVESASMTGNGAGTARLRYSNRDDVTPIWQDIEDRILRNVSFGARINQLEMIPPGAEGNELWIYRATNWEPYEISPVPVGADPDATMRGGGGPSADSPRLFPCVFTERSINNGVQTSSTQRANVMATTEGQVQPTQEATAAPVQQPGASGAGPDDGATQRAEGARLERQRIADIQGAVRAARLTDSENLIRGFIDAGTSADTVRAEVLRRLAEQGDAQQVQGQRVDASVVDNSTQRREAMVNALMHRVNPAVELSEQGRSYRGMTLRELCRASLEDHGIATRGMNVREIAGIALGVVQRGGYQTTGDLPLVFGAVIARTMRQAYQAAPKSFTAWARQTTITDFRPVTRVAFDGAVKLEKVNEAGEYKYGSLVDSGETYQLGTFGKIVAFTRQMIINDDLSALERLPMLFGNAAADLESDIVYGILTSNPKMSDGLPVFDPKHNNVGTAADIDVDALSAGRTAMRTQKSPGGTLLNLSPSTLLVPAALETRAQQMTSAGYTPNEAGKQNPFTNTLTPVAEARLDASSPSTWYLMASVGRIDTVEFAYLDGEAGLYTEQAVDFDVDGMKVKGRLDFAAKAIDFRGMYRVTAK